MKTIAEIAVDVIRDAKCIGVMWGDVGLLDDIALRATHTTLMSKHPLDRHQAILNSLEKSKLFKKGHIRVHVGEFSQERLVRYFELKKQDN